MKSIHNGSAARARADFADELANHGGDNGECNPFRTGEVLIGRDQDKAAQAHNRAMHIFPVIGFYDRIVLGVALEAAAGLCSLALPAGLALLACAMGLGERDRSSEKRASRIASAVYDHLPSLTPLHSQSRRFGTNGFAKDQRSVPSDWR